MKREIIIMKDCSSPYIVKYLGSYIKNNNLWLIMEYVHVGAVTDIMKICEISLSEL